jgi:hypothetical protein
LSEIETPQSKSKQSKNLDFARFDKINKPVFLSLKWYNYTLNQASKTVPFLETLSQFLPMAEIGTLYFRHLSNFGISKIVQKTKNLKL